MDNTIYYFTGTGNSLKVAKDIAAGVENSSIVSMAANMGKISELAPQGAVGFVFPEYYCGLPQLVRKFISSVDLSGALYIYVAGTYGTTAGNGGCVSQARKILKGKGKKLNAAFYVKSVDIFILWTWDVPPAGKHPELHENARKKADLIAKTVSDKKDYCDRSIGEYILPAVFGYNHFLKTVNASGKAFNLSGQCASCGLCADVCPTGNIRLENGSPVWNDEKCQRCLACLHLCPSACIQYGKVTKKRRRYRNPHITVDELKRENQES